MSKKHFKYIDENAAWYEREIEDNLKNNLFEVQYAKENGIIKEEDEFELRLEGNGHPIIMSLKSLAKFSTGDLLKEYKARLVEDLDDHRMELELDKEDGIQSKKFHIN